MTAEEVALEEFRRAVYSFRRAHQLRRVARAGRHIGWAREEWVRMRRDRAHAHSLARIIRAIRADRAEHLREIEVGCENTPWPGCECPGCMTARERAEAVLKGGDDG